jgi:hypothetical protein
VAPGFSTAVALAEVVNTTCNWINVGFVTFGPGQTPMPGDTRSVTSCFSIVVALTDVVSRTTTRH